MHRLIATIVAAALVSACGDATAPAAAGTEGVLVPGTTATITGSGFSPTPDANTVTVDGVPAPVLSATPTELTVLVPRYPCQPSREVEVTITAPGGTVRQRHILRTATELAPAVGEAVFVSDSGQLSCMDLVPAGGRYLVNVYNVSTVSSSSADFELQGSPPAAGVAAATAAAPVRGAVASAGLSPIAGVAAWRRAAEHRARDRMAESDRALLRREPRLHRSLRARRSAAAGLSRAVAAAVPLTPGTTTTLRVRNEDDCSGYTEVTGRVVYVGPRAIVVEDNLAPLAGQMDADYGDLGREFESTMFPILTQYFGNPLAVDAETDANQRIVMLFTPVINNRGANLLGFVSLCDFFPPTASPSVAASNQAEIFYARVPNTLTGTGTDARPGWKRHIRATLIHETKHIVSYAEKLARTPADQDLNLEESWLEEGTAQVAEELFGRTIWRTAWKGDATYRQTMYCDVREDPVRFPECANNAYAIVDQFFFLHDYATEHESKSLLSPGSEDNTIYGSGWWFARWAADNHAPTEPAFFRSLTQETRLTGVENVVARTGRPWTELLGNWLFTFVADNRPGLAPRAGARYTVPSWNLPDIWAGMSNDFRGISTQPFGVRPVAAGAFTVSATVRAAAGAMIDLAGSGSGRQLLILRAGGGAPLPTGSTLRIGVLRVP